MNECMQSDTYGGGQAAALALEMAGELQLYAPEQTDRVPGRPDIPPAGDWHSYSDVYCEEEEEEEEEEKKKKVIIRIRI
jgi:hypothetical protein